MSRLLYTAKRISPADALSHVVRIRCGRTYGDFKLGTDGALYCIGGNHAPGPDALTVTVQTMATQTLADGHDRTVKR